MRGTEGAPPQVVRCEEVVAGPSDWVRRHLEYGTPEGPDRSTFLLVWGELLCLAISTADEIYSVQNILLI